MFESTWIIAERQANVSMVSMGIQRYIIILEDFQEL